MSATSQRAPKKNFSLYKSYMKTLFTTNWTPGRNALLFSPNVISIISYKPRLQFGKVSRTSFTVLLREGLRHIYMSRYHFIKVGKKIWYGTKSLLHDTYLILVRPVRFSHLDTLSWEADLFSVPIIPGLKNFTFDLRTLCSAFYTKLLLLYRLCKTFIGGNCSKSS